MASKRIRVLISSRCADRIRAAAAGSVEISDVHIRAMEAFRMFDCDTFESRVHENERAMDGGADICDHWLDQFRRCDLLLVLYNGNADFGKSNEQVGICHAELAEALRTNAATVRIIDIWEGVSLRFWGSRERNKRFDEYKDRQKLGGRFASNEDQALRLLMEVLQDPVASMVRTSDYTIAAACPRARL